MHVASHNSTRNDSSKCQENYIFYIHFCIDFHSGFTLFHRTFTFLFHEDVVEAQLSLSTSLFWILGIPVKLILIHMVSMICKSSLQIFVTKCIYIFTHIITFLTFFSLFQTIYAFLENFHSVHCTNIYSTTTTYLQMNEPLLGRSQLVLVFFVPGYIHIFTPFALHFHFFHFIFTFSHLPRHSTKNIFHNKTLPTISHLSNMNQRTLHIPRSHKPSLYFLRSIYTLFHSTFHSIFTFFTLFSLFCKFYGYLRHLLQTAREVISFRIYSPSFQESYSSCRTINSVSRFLEVYLYIHYHSIFTFSQFPKIETLIYLLRASEKFQKLQFMIFLS